MPKLESKDYYYNKTTKKWQVLFTHDGQRICMNTYDTEEEAKKAAYRDKNLFIYRDSFK
jgi:hypothetical protein